MLQEQSIEHDLESYRGTNEVCMTELKSSCKKIYVIDNAYISRMRFQIGI